MEDIIITIILVLIALAVIVFIFAKSEKNKATIEESFYNKIKELGYEIIEKDDGVINQIIKNEQVTFLVKIIKIPEYAEIQINNKVTWEIKYGAGNTPGKAQPYKKW